MDIRERRRVGRLVLFAMLALCAVGLSEAADPDSLPQLRSIDVINLIGLFALGIKAGLDIHRARQNGKTAATGGDEQGTVIHALREEIRYLRTANHEMRNVVQPTVTKVAVLESLLTGLNTRLDRIEGKLETIGEWLAAPRSRGDAP